MMEVTHSSEEQQGDVATKGDVRRLESRMESMESRIENVESSMATKDDLARTEKSIRSDMAVELERFEKSIRSDMAVELERFEKSIRADMATKDDLSKTNEYVKGVENRLTSQINQLRDDIGPIKDAHATSSAIREADLIAEEMGFRFVRVLERSDIRRLVNGQDLPGVSPDDVKSFRRADMILEVTDSQGEVAYIAAEISFTADERDTNRAIRNAEYMNRLTGKQARAAVVGLRRDNRIEPISQSEVFWYDLPQSSLHSD